LFRYYPSKNNILCGQFDDSLREFRWTFRHMPRDIPIARAVHDAIVAFHQFDSTAIPQHRRRMRLLFGTPQLLAHAELRYAPWRSLVAEYVAERLSLPVDDLLPPLAGRVAPAIACLPTSVGLRTIKVTYRSESKWRRERWKPFPGRSIVRGADQVHHTQRGSMCPRAAGR
jgi:hypothetical protein